MSGHHPHDEARTMSPYAARIRAIEALLLEKNVLTEPEVQDGISYMEARSPANGAKLVARAWMDDTFKALLLSDGKRAASELGMQPEHPAEFVVVENTPNLHNMIVCTLCSCYPRAILGRPPDWYKSFEYRSRAVKEPRAVMHEFGFEPPDSVEVIVHDSTADVRYMVLPMRPPGTGDLNEQELARLVTRDCLVGVSVPRASLSPGRSRGSTARS